MVDYIIGIGTVILVVGIIVSSILNSKKGKKTGVCTGNCSACSACKMHYTFEDKIK